VRDGSIAKALNCGYRKEGEEKGERAGAKRVSLAAPVPGQHRHNQTVRTSGGGAKMGRRYF